MKMKEEIELQNGMKHPGSHWESKVVCITGVSPWALAKKVNDAYAGKFVVATQVFRDGEEWVALVYFKVKALIQQSRKECAGTPRAAAVEQALHYFLNNASRVQYGTFRKAKYFIGSGVVEAGCKTISGGRCEQSGMFWSKLGAQNILALRCIHNSQRLEKFWKCRLDAKAAANDCLPLAA